MNNPTCRDKRPCFARHDGRCEILTEALAFCPFCKPERLTTKGKAYPYEEWYSDRKKKTHPWDDK